MTPLGIYVHIPFCVRKCRYCDFPSFGGKEALKEQYVERLCAEIRERTESEGLYGTEADTVFFGGGTPSLLTKEEMTRIMATLRSCFTLLPGAEITVEVNPKTATLSTWALYEELGINRISLGLQAVQDELLSTLGRVHTFADFGKTYGELSRFSTFSVNIDLMEGLPGQTPAQWEETLQTVCDLKPDHISAYSLIVEPGTVFGNWFQKGEGTPLPPLPDEDREWEMYQKTIDYLSQRGYERYEISNYAKCGKACRHNIKYWKSLPYVGFGLSATGLLDGVRTVNTRSLPAYLKGEPAEKIKLSRTEEMGEFCLMSLRMQEGIDRRAFLARFGVKVEDVFPLSFRHTALMGENEHAFFLTREGMAVSNQIMEEFV